LSSASAAASAKRHASSNSSSLKDASSPSRYMFSVPLTTPRAISGIEISASGSSAGVPGTVTVRGSRWAWFARTGSRWSAAQPVMPTPNSERLSMILSAHLSRANTGIRTVCPSSAW
jgi:hypothetical protein